MAASEVQGDLASASKGLADSAARERKTIEKVRIFKAKNAHREITLNDCKEFVEDSSRVRPQVATDLVKVSKVLDGENTQGTEEQKFEPVPAPEVERDVAIASAFKGFRFTAQQQKPVEQIRITKALKDKKIALNELKKFGETFKLRTPVPADLVSIIGKVPKVPDGKSTQSTERQKAWTEFERYMGGAYPALEEQMGKGGKDPTRLPLYQPVEGEDDTKDSEAVATKENAAQKPSTVSLVVHKSLALRQRPSSTNAHYGSADDEDSSEEPTGGKSNNKAAGGRTLYTFLSPPRSFFQDSTPEGQNNEKRVGYKQRFDALPLDERRRIGEQWSQSIKARHRARAALVLKQQQLQTERRKRDIEFFKHHNKELDEGAKPKKARFELALRAKKEKEDALPMQADTRRPTPVTIGQSPIMPESYVRAADFPNEQMKVLGRSTINSSSQIPAPVFQSHQVTLTREPTPGTIAFPKYMHTNGGFKGARIIAGLGAIPYYSQTPVPVSECSQATEPLGPPVNPPEAERGRLAEIVTMESPQSQSPPSQPQRGSNPSYFRPGPSCPFPPALNGLGPQYYPPSRGRIPRPEVRVADDIPLSHSPLALKEVDFIPKQLAQPHYNCAPLDGKSVEEEARRVTAMLEEQRNGQTKLTHPTQQTEFAGLMVTANVCRGGNWMKGENHSVSMSHLLFPGKEADTHLAQSYSFAKFTAIFERKISTNHLIKINYGNLSYIGGRVQKQKDFEVALNYLISNRTQDSDTLTFFLRVGDRDASGGSLGEASHKAANSSFSFSGPLTAGSDPFQDLGMETIPNAQQAQKIPMLAARDLAEAPLSGFEKLTLQNYKTPMVVNERQIFERLMLVKKSNEMLQMDTALAKDAVKGSVSEVGKNHALQDYQTQLMLLEQQNKRRLELANE
jgi:hypothetical protein